MEQTIRKWTQEKLGSFQYVIYTGFAFGLTYQYVPIFSVGETVTKYWISATVALLVLATSLILGNLSTKRILEKTSNDVRYYEAISIAQRTGAKIAERLTEQGDGTSAIGHYLEGNSPVSPLSTAYAIRGIVACPSVVKVASLCSAVQYIKSTRSQLGWKAASQFEARPEVTADIVRSICAIDGDSAFYKEALVGLVNQCSIDSVHTNVTYVAASLLCSLPRKQETQKLRESILQSIRSSFIQSGEDAGYWSLRLAGGRSASNPSIAITARCLIALGDDTTASEMGDALPIARRALKWISAQRSFPNESEHIDRYVGEGSTEVLVPRHFTAAHVVMAAAAWSQIDEAKQLAIRAFDEVLASYRDGYWRWTDGRCPVWMNAQGIEAVNQFVIALGGWKR
jgi:hypothetical protein